MTKNSSPWNFRHSRNLFLILQQSNDYSEIDISLFICKFWFVVCIYLHDNYNYRCCTFFQKWREMLSRATCFLYVAFYKIAFRFISRFEASNCPPLPLHIYAIKKRLLLTIYIYFADVSTYKFVFGIRLKYLSKIGNLWAFY